MRFLRTGTDKFKRLGRKKKLKWRKARGRHNKIREKRRGKPKKVEIGFKRASKEKTKINLVRNLKEAGQVGKGEQIVIAKIGKKKRKEIENKINERGGKILNIRK